MPGFKKYKLNQETLLYEKDKLSPGARVIRILVMAVVCCLITLMYFWLFSSVLGIELPKTTWLKRENARWESKMQIMNMRLDRCEDVLDGLEQRDAETYRNIFGMNRIAEEVRNSGMSDLSARDGMEKVDAGSALSKTATRLDFLSKKAFVQSKSFDDISAVSKKAGDMISCIPAVPPINPDPSTYRMSSQFGTRVDPITHEYRTHSGCDFACPPGNPIYVTGNGTVESVSFDLFGYGNCVVVDHGFGYKTRYAHMRTIYVTEGMKLKRGECLGESGNSGRSTGPHLHYEVLYKGSAVNPTNYFDMEMSVDEFKNMVKKAEEESPNVIIRPGQRVKRR